MSRGTSEPSSSRSRAAEAARRAGRAAAFLYEGGSGIAVQWDGWAHVAGSLVERSADSGIQAFAAELTVESTLVSAPQPASGLYGDGVTAFGGGSVVLSHISARRRGQSPRRATGW